MGVGQFFRYDGARWSSPGRQPLAFGAVFRGASSAGDGATASASSITIAVPNGSATGDYMVVGICSNTNSATLSTPSGWTLVSGPFDNGSGLRMYLFGKILGTADITAGSVGLLWSSAVRTVAVAATIQNPNTADPIGTPQISANNAASSASVTADAGSVVLEFCFSGSSSGTPPATAFSGMTNDVAAATNLASGVNRRAILAHSNAPTHQSYGGHALLNGYPTSSLDTIVTVVINAPVVTNSNWRGQVLIGHWDESELRSGTTPGKNYVGNKGVDTAMAAVRADNKPAPISQIQKAYPSGWQTNYASSPVQYSGEFGHTFMITQQLPGSISDILAGVYDTQLVAWVNSIPLTETAYTCIVNEPDNCLGANRSWTWEPTDICQAIGYIINKLAPIYRSRGLKGGVGTVLMGYPLAYGDQGDGTKGVPYFDKFDYLQYVDPSNMGQVVYMMDCYAKMAPNGASYAGYVTTHEGVAFESVSKIVQIAFDQARLRYGVTRFGIGETGNSRQQRFASTNFPGTAATQETWVNHEVPSMCTIPGMEFVIYFHKPTGKESQYDQLLDDGDGQPFTAYANVI